LKTKNSEVQINSVVGLSEAYLEGIRENDTIVSIDGVEHADISTYRDILKQQNKSVKIKFLTTDGTIKEIEIKLERLL
jgi:S1-C subfamily serine protease